MCNIKILGSSVWRTWGLAVLLALACRSTDRRSEPIERPVAAVGPALPTDRISIVGASVSAGFGGAPFGDAFQAAAKRSKIESAANLFLFRDPIGDSRLQIDQAIAFDAQTIIALDFLFWDIYGSTDHGWRERALASGLAELERARQRGAWIVVGDVPHIVTASELMLPRRNVPDAATLARFNAKIAAWADGRERVLLVPFASWAEPLAAGGEIELANGEKVPARSLIALDGLHANALGVWAILDRLDHYIELKLPGTPRDALVFVRPGAAAAAGSP